MKIIEESSSVRIRIDMSESILQQLQRSADLALKSESVQEGVQHLSRAFALFSEEASQLKNAYVKLQERFDAVNGELGIRVAELNRITRFLNNVLKHISESILFLDLEGTVAIMNESAGKLLGLDPEKVLFKKFWDLLPDDYFGFSMKEALKFGIPHKLIYKSYPPKELEIGASFVYEGPKPYHGLIVLFRDVSEKQKLQQIANRNSRMKELGEMAATVAHEIRNPLGGIRGYASLLYRDLKDQKNLQEMAGLIIEGTKSLERLVTTVLHYSRPIQIAPQSIEVGQFLKQLVKFIKVDPASPQNIKWSLHIPDSPLLAPADPEALKSALLNLIFNAFQAMPEGGVLTLSLLKIDSCYQITISDTGIGMGEELLAKLFSPFFTTKEKGNGLGLVEAQKIVQAHHGSIEVRSILNKGTTFTLTFPLKR